MTILISFLAIIGIAVVWFGIGMLFSPHHEFEEYTRKQHIILTITSIIALILIIMVWVWSYQTEIC